MLLSHFASVTCGLIGLIPVLASWTLPAISAREDFTELCLNSLAMMLDCFHFLSFSYGV